MLFVLESYRIKREGKQHFRARSPAELVHFSVNINQGVSKTSHSHVWRGCPSIYEEVVVNPQARAFIRPDEKRVRKGPRCADLAGPANADKI